MASSAEQGEGHQEPKSRRGDLHEGDARGPGGEGDGEEGGQEEGGEGEDYGGEWIREEVVGVSG